MYSMRLVFFVCNLLGTIIGLAIFLPCMILLRKKDYKTKLIPLKVTFAFLVTFEIAKIYYLIGRNNNFHARSYPFIYCSSVMYLLAMVCFAKKDSFLNRLGLGGIGIPFMVIGGLYYFSFPNLDNTCNLLNFILNIHSRVYHILAFFCALYIAVNKLYDYRFKDFLPVSAYSALYIQLCTVLSLFMRSDLSVFGPWTSEIKVVYNYCEYATGNLLLSIACLLIGFIVYLVINLIRSSISKSKNKKNKISKESEKVKSDKQA